MRPIDADELLKDKSSNAYISRFEIDNAPTVDAEPVVHAHWIEDYKYGIQTFVCSNCKLREKYEFKYCRCGCKMDEEQE